ncbi:TIGR01244 family protein [Brevundimonas sp. LM2]|uniref:TIGR01244 family sulfur transferase n=1 Tax=Brevundimonas sp. LM2 TaxID=1938605 RepID=UPI000983D6D4|nr:TIGR01244 family sulfur transferase [Brevundimonas sp. LM2]AQR61573.1 TIGR01244 family protein [Brevundimonas sp. LM2]
MTVTSRPLAPGLWIAPQIALDDLPDLAAQGVRRIVSHRPDGEDAGQPNAAVVAAAAQAAGLEFVHVPVAGMPGPDAIAATARALEDGAPTLMFCRSGTRSVFAWALAMRSLDRADAQTLRAAAAAVGYDLSRLPL